MQNNEIDIWRVDLGKKIFWLKNSVQNPSGYLEIWNPLLNFKSDEDFKNKNSDCEGGQNGR